mmetsp:Transcript_69662/g.181219  ORF Transcript_69662/g.181219 Transcript_69662/m.181219 type:complete len:321 (-) Transcript_69662:67-1029(-)
MCRQADHRDVGTCSANGIQAGRDAARAQPALQTLERGDYPVGAHVAAASAGIDVALLDGIVRGLVAVLPDHHDLAAPGNGQGAVLVLQKHGTVHDRLEGHPTVGVAGAVGLNNLLLLAALRAHVVAGPARGDGEAAVEVAGHHHRRNDVQHLLVHTRLRHFARPHHLRQLVELVRKPLRRVVSLHVDVQARVRGPLHVVRRTPVADDEALEVERVAEEGLQQLAVLASVLAVDLVVGAHDRCRTRLKCRLEHRQVDLVLGAVADLHIHGLPVDLLVVVQEVLHTSDDAMVLDGLHEGRHELRAQVGVLARNGLEAAACEH